MYTWYRFASLWTPNEIGFDIKPSHVKSGSMLTFRMLTKAPIKLRECKAKMDEEYLILFTLITATGEINLSVDIEAGRAHRVPEDVLHSKPRKGRPAAKLYRLLKKPA